MTPEAPPVIEVEQLSAGYGARVVLRDVSFSVRRGEVFVILGGSGCGKSTLLRHLIGLAPPLAGRVRIHGCDLTGGDRAARARTLMRIGVLFQSGALFGSMTLAENIFFPLDEHTALPRTVKEAAVEMKLRLVGLADHAGYLPGELSGGQQKRAGLARAMALEPDILFFDEPSAGLDPITSAALDQLIVELNRSLGLTMVVVTHELPSIFTIAHRVIMLDGAAQGIVAEGDPRALREHASDARVRHFLNREPS